MKTIGLCSVVATMAAPSCFAAVLISSGNINDAANWDTGALPGAGEIGTVNIDASWPNTASATALGIGGDLVFGGGSTLTAETDIVGVNPNSVTFNNVTVNVGDDIFTGGSASGTGNFIFNAGSITNVNDDFQANGNGLITVNGGDHTVGDRFGAQAGSTLNFLGGEVLSGEFNIAGATVSLGGGATLEAATLDLSGSTFDIASNWTGSLDVSNVADWQATLTGAGVTLDGVAIDAGNFDDNFIVSGTTLTLAVPEPSSTALLGLGGLALLARRTRK